jgi:hypothetical protein
MLRNASWRDARVSSGVTVVVATVAIVCFGTLCNSQGQADVVIKRKLVIAQDLRLDVASGTLQCRLSKSPAGLASLAFFDVANKRSLGLAVEHDGTPTMFLRSENPKTLTQLAVPAEGSAFLFLGDASVEGKLPGFSLRDDGEIILNGADGDPRIVLSAVPAGQIRTIVSLLNRKGRQVVVLYDIGGLPNLSLADGERGARTSFVVEAKRGASVIFTDSKQRPRLSLNTDPTGIPRVMLFDPDNNLATSLKGR